MAFQSTALRVLISCPGDITSDDLAVVHKAITRWNVLLGEQLGYVVIPVSWSEHAAAEFGEPPQDILNRQLVDVVDLGIAIFWARLGTPTGNSDSGTAEEINRLHDAGRPVSILRCNRAVPPRGDHSERARLDEFLTGIFGRALVVGYDDNAALSSQVDTILTRMVTNHESDWELNGLSGGFARGVRSQIVPSVETSHISEADSKGRLKSKSRHELVLQNTGSVEARAVRWSLSAANEEESGGIPWVGGSGEGGARSVPVIAGGARISYPIMGSMGSADMFMCKVEWEENGRERKCETALRT